MEVKLFDSELRIMEILWTEGDQTAKVIAERTNEQVGWSKTTTYTVIKKCLEKGAVQRIEPGFICHALITRQQAQHYEVNELMGKLFQGSPDQLVASILGSRALSKEEIQRLKQLVDELE